MGKLESLSKELTSVIKAQSRKPTPYDTKGEVKAIRDGVAYVHFYGSDIDETPVQLTINAEVGDEVVVRASGGRAYIIGNATSPPTDDREAKKASRQAREAQAKAKNATEVAEDAKGKAEDAQATATDAQTQAADAVSKANSSVASDTLHYLATSYDSGVTTADSPSTYGTWTTTIQTISEEKPYLWTYHTYHKASGQSVNTSPVITGTYGEKGADGTSVTILGSYDTLADLESAHPTGNVGDSYMVAGDLYIWNGTAWEDVGQIQGPQGPQGPQGQTGATGATGAAGHSPVVTATKSDGTTTIKVDGTTIATILDGTNGSNGHSPAITTTKIGSSTYIYADSTLIGTVADGADGQAPTITANRYGAETKISVDGTVVAVINDGTDGDDGNDGVTFTPSVDSSGNISWTNDGGRTNPQTQNIKGADGHSPVVTATKSGSTTTVKVDGTTIATILDGQDGDDGIDGDNGYVHVAWANSSDGTVDFSTSVSTGKSYLGTYTDNTQADSQDPTDYSWSHIQGVTFTPNVDANGNISWSNDGGKSNPQSQNIKGADVTSVQPQYHNHTSTTATAQEIASWTWSTTLTYETGKYIWTRDYVTYSNGNTSTSTAIYNQALTEACSKSEGALALAEGIEEHFWHDDSTGAHITQVTQAEYEADPDNAGGNLLMTSQGMAVRDGRTELATFTGTAAQIGKSSGAHSVVDADGLRIYGGDGTRSIAHMGYGASGNNWWTYFTFGSRKSGTTSGSSSFAEGEDITATGTASHAEGSQTSASGAESHAEGFWSSASKAYAHAEGRHTEANGEGAHAEGYYTEANGDYSHAQGNQTTADGDYSTAQGKGTTANEDCQTVVGMYNDTSITGVPLFVVGNGTVATPSNAFYVNSTGYAVSKTGFKVNGNPLFKVREVTSVDNQTIAASATNSYYDQKVALTADTNYTGYTPIGVIDYLIENATTSGVGCSWCHAYKCGLVNENSTYKVHWGVRNMGSIQVKIKLTARILYAATGIL